jgi:pimeloyl-ACP methyl ester carboxylesterase
MKLPSNIQSHLELLNDLLKEDITLNRRVPDLLDLMASILEKLESRPVTVETIHPESDDAVEVTLGKYDLQLATATGLGKTAFLRALPSRYLTMAAGDYSWLGEQVIQLRLGQKSSLMYETTDYASGATVARREQIAQEAPTTLLGDAINEPFHQLGDVLGDIDLGDNFRGRLVCEVPALLVCGTLDVRTPISNAQELLPDLAKGQLLTIDGVSHDLAYRGDHIEKLTNIRDQFLRGEPVNYEQLSSPFVFQSIENNVH